MNLVELARTYADGYSGKSGNAECSGEVYRLFGHAICIKRGGMYHFSWCNHYTRSTARHINNILSALGTSHRVSYAQARDAGIDTFIIVR